MNTTYTSPDIFHVTYDIPANMRHLLDDDQGQPFDFCAVSFRSRDEAEEYATHANEIECHGHGVKHHVMSGAEVEAARLDA